MTDNNFVPPIPGQELPPPPPEALDGITFDDEPSVPTEQKAPEPTTPEPKQEEKTPSPEVNTEAKGSSLPTRFEGESDVQYELRTKLFIAGQAKANAETPEEKSLISQEMKRIRGDMAKEKKEEGQPTPQTQQPAPAEDEREIVKKNLQEMGYKTADEIARDVQKILEEQKQSQQAEARHAEHTSAITDFYKTRPDIFIDDTMRNNVETQVLTMFKDSLPTMSRQQLLVALDMAANYLYPKGAITKKIDAAQEKVDALNIHGSQGGDVTPSTVSDQTKSKLRDMGWSDRDIESFEKK